MNCEDSFCSRSVRSIVSGPCEISFFPSSFVAWAIRVTVGGTVCDIGLSELVVFGASAAIKLLPSRLWPLLLLVAKEVLKELLKDKLKLDFMLLPLPAVFFGRAASGVEFFLVLGCSVCEINCLSIVAIFSSAIFSSASLVSPSCVLSSGVLGPSGCYKAGTLSKCFLASGGLG